MQPVNKQQIQDSLKLPGFEGYQARLTENEPLFLNSFHKGPVVGKIDCALLPVSLAAHQFCSIPLGFSLNVLLSVRVMISQATLFLHDDHRDQSLQNKFALITPYIVSAMFIYAIPFFCFKEEEEQPLCVIENFHFLYSIIVSSVYVAIAALEDHNQSPETMAYNRARTEKAIVDIDTEQARKTHAELLQTITRYKHTSSATDKANAKEQFLRLYKILKLYLRLPKNETRNAINKMDLRTINYMFSQFIKTTTKHQQELPIAVKRARLEMDKLKAARIFSICVGSIARASLSQLVFQQVITPSSTKDFYETKYAYVLALNGLLANEIIKVLGLPVMATVYLAKNLFVSMFN